MIENKLEKLRDIIKGCDSLVVAYSGGVDSSLLLYEAKKVLREKAIAVTMNSVLIPTSEIEDAKLFCRTHGIEHIITDLNVFSIEGFRENSIDRCYICKKLILKTMIGIAERKGMKNVVHGANLDDLNDFRPGMKAASELKILSPLIDAGFTKKDIRRIAEAEGLKVYNKPEMACLASRIPTGSEITVEKLKTIELSEEFLKKEGFSKFRVRYVSGAARIELEEEVDFIRIMDSALRNKTVETLKKYGFKNITLDLEGYKKGAMNI